MSVPKAGIFLSNAADASVASKCPGERVILAISYVSILLSVGARVERNGRHPCWALLSIDGLVRVL